MPSSTSALQRRPQRPVTIHNAYPRLRLDRRAIIRAIHALDAHHSLLRPSAVARRRAGALAEADSALQPFSNELSLAFLPDAALATLHADFLDDPTPTDVITFTGDSRHGLGGEICVSVDAALRQSRPGRAGRTGRQTRSLSTELTLYLVHGWLHLAGHDDLAPGPRRRMRRAETRALGHLHAAGLIPRFALITT